MWGLLTSEQENMCRILQKHWVLGSTRCFLSMRDATWLCWRSTGLQLLSLAALRSTERLVLLLRVWGLKPHSHQHHREMECSGLMTHRKSDKPHSHPSASSGHHWAPKCPAHSQPQALDKACGNIVSAFTHVPFAREHARHCCSLRCSTSSVTSAEVAGVSARQDTEQEGWNGVQGDLTPSRLMGN